MSKHPYLPIGLRKFIGMFGLIGVLIVYTIFAVTIGVTYIHDLGPFAQLPYYVIAGTLWAVPAKAVIYWMQRPDKPDTAH